MTTDPSHQVRRRRVFYVPGFDPCHARRYRELYRSEGRDQAAISGYTLEQRPSPRKEVFGWDVTGRIEGAEVEAEIDVLVWTDIVRASMRSGITATYGQLAQTAWIYLSSGALWRLLRLRKGPMLAALYPVAMLLVQLALALGVAAALASLLPGVLSWLALAVVPPILMVFRRIDNKLVAHYLMHDYAFAARWGGANAPALEARMSTFTDQIADALQEDFDEVLIVGHSSGAYVAVSLVADLLRQGRVPFNATLSLLTLGHVIPMVSFLPKADRLRRDLAALSVSESITWIDVTAPGDGAAFALCDPVAVSGVAPVGKRWPLVISCAFTQTLSPERWAALRWRFFRLHFQYMSAFDRPKDYDYFRITAGPQTLGQRFAGRAPSRSRIERPVSGHTSQAA